jgi:hypothetical protein
MSFELADRLCSTRVSRVQFGVPPNCGEARGFALARWFCSLPGVLTVSGETPETTRQRRVLPARRGDFSHA